MSSNLFLREAWRSLLRHKVRSGLSVLGVTVGIAAVVLVVGLGEAGSRRAQAQLAALGDNFVWVEAGSRNINGLRTGTHGMTNLTLDDAEAIRQVPGIKLVSPQLDGTVLVANGNPNWTTRWRGESAEYLAIKQWPVALGQPLSQEDVDRRAGKIVLGQTVREQLFGADNPVGEIVRIQGMLYEVAGVLTARGQSTDGRDQDDWILMPWTTAVSRLRGRGVSLWLDDILCSATSPEEVGPAIDRITALLRQRHHLAPGAEDDFNIRRPDEVLKAQLDAKNTLARLLLSVAAVSLLVGGIGVMNVMLASVTQRTREIGVRLAVGARERDIQAQFLGEAVVLSLAGGVLGIGLSYAGSLAFARLLDWPVAVSLPALGLAVLFSALVGVLFGFYPARHAARLDPVTCLHSE